jgi:DNA-binding SARP family transcriptional activator
MRLSRTTLLDRLTAPDVPAVILLEAPPGYGKSWLARRALGGDVLRLRGELGPLARATAPHRGPVLIDDAHLLTKADVELLAERVEDAGGDGRLVIAGRILAPALHEAAQLVDGLVIDAEALAVGPDEVAEQLHDSRTLAQRLCEAADGCVRMIATALEQSQRDPALDAVAVASQMVRVAADAALQHLDSRERSVVALLARAPGIDAHLLDRLGGPGFVDRAVAAGVPLRRRITGALELASAAALRAAPIDAALAAELADDMLARGRALEAIGLILDAGDHQRAAAMMKALSESIAETVEPRPMLSLLARLGSRVGREPELLLLRASANRTIGQLDEAVRDIDQAVVVAADAPPPVRRRVAIESARARLAEGDLDTAEAIARLTLAELGEGEVRTFARGHQVLAEAASMSDAREDLQRAAESYRVAANAWESCSEYARSRICRTALSLGVLSPLGRFDEALAQIGQVLSAPDLSDAERAITMLTEGFVLLNANRLDSAELRFERIADLGYVHDNQRLIAIAAWGMGAIASRRGDLDATLRWIATAENTALGKADDLLGVPFLCDVAEMLGALGELDLAADYLERVADRASLFPGQVLSERFLLDARRGVLGDVDAALSHTLPHASWRIKLAAAHALARGGDLDAARRLLHDAGRDLVSLGYGDFASLGEGRLYEATRAALRAEPATPSPEAPALATFGMGQAHGLHLSVMGGGMTVTDADATTVIPFGNPQRLVGVIVASGGSASIDQVSEALWADEDAERSRTRLRNVLLRLRRAAGDVIVRSGNGLRLAPGVTCDLVEFRRRAADALAAARAHPELAGELAAAAVSDGDLPAFLDFEYDEWAVAVRREIDQQRISLLDLLSVQAEDAGDLPTAQVFAERALRLDRYTDSRYVRLAELLTLQNRVAAAIAVLDDAAAVARELGSGTPGAAKQRRAELLRRAVTRV